MIDRKKVAIVLMNLGGPDSPGSIRKFLFNLFYDKYIIKIPNPFRFILASLISVLRLKKSTKIYNLIGGRSPILEETFMQGNALQNEMLQYYQSRVFISMRHFKPYSCDIMDDIKEFDPEKLVLIPLYPQYSTTTTISSVEDFVSNLKLVWDEKKIYDSLRIVCCYYNNDYFIDAYVKLILESNIDFANTKVIFSAHSIPKNRIRNGDPYEWQINNCVKLIVDKISSILHSNFEYIVSYQSRVGPIEWLVPDTKDEILKCCVENKGIALVPISFVSEHVETLVELDIDYKNIAVDYGLPYTRVQTLRDGDLFIKCIANCVNMAVNSSSKIISGGDNVFCKNNFTMCPCKI